MIELLDNLDLLKETSLDVTALQLDGVPFGMDTKGFPRHKIVEVTGSPLVASSRSGTDIEAEYFTADGTRVPLADVIDSVLYSNGVVHFASKMSFAVARGRVVTFALYGDHLRHFDSIGSYDAFLASFGKPDRSDESVAYSDLMGYWVYYFASAKCIYWDCMDNRVTLVNLGMYRGNDDVLRDRVV